MANASSTVCIRPSQQRLHVVGEALAVALVVPFMGYLVTRRDLPTWARVGAGATGVFSLLVDGFLLVQYARRAPGWWGR